MSEEIVKLTNKPVVEFTNEIAAALAKAQGEFPEITFDSEVEVTMKSGGKYRFKYATLTNIIRATRPALSANGLALVQTFENTVLTTRLIHSSGQQLTSTIELPIDDSMSNQDIGGVMTYFKRYSISAILGVSADADDDSNGASGNQAKQTDLRKPAPTPRKAPEAPKKAPATPVKGKVAPKQDKPATEATEALPELPKGPVPEIRNQKPPKAVAPESGIVDVSVQGSPTAARTPYGIASSGSPTISAESATRAKNALAKFGVTEVMLNEFSGFPVEMWTEDMKVKALKDFHALESGMTWEQVTDPSFVQE